MHESGSCYYNSVYNNEYTVIIFSGVSEARPCCGRAGGTNFFKYNSHFTPHIHTIIINFLIFLTVIFIFYFIRCKFNKCIVIAIIINEKKTKAHFRGERGRTHITFSITPLIILYFFNG